ncbi:MAG TPA: hypothetical protein VIK79_07910, partial [Xanthobacteraceae bacterium]
MSARQRGLIGPARPSVVDCLHHKRFEIFMHPLRPCLDVRNDRAHGLIKRHVSRRAGAMFFIFRREFAHHEIDCIDNAHTHALHDCIQGLSRGLIVNRAAAIPKHVTGTGFILLGRR